MEKEKIAQLDNLLLALGFADTSEKLEICLGKYLLTLLNFFRFQNQIINKKVLEVLTVINQRLKLNPSLKLPLAGLVDQYYDKETPVVQKNFTIIYLIQAFDRSSHAEKEEYMERLLLGVSEQNVLHQGKLLGVGLTLLSHRKINRYSSEKELDDLKLQYPFLVSPSDKSLILLYLYYFMISPYECYSFNSKEGIRKVAGLSEKWRKRLVEAFKIKSEDEFDTMKVKFIELLESLSPSILSFSDIIYIILAAKSSLSSRVCAIGDDALKRIDKLRINFEDPLVINRLYELYNGSDEKGVNVEDVITSVSPEFKLLIIYQLKRSILAANLSLKPVKVILDALNGEAANTKTRQAGLALAHWVFSHADQSQVIITGQIIFSYILKLLRSFHIEADNNNNADKSEVGIGGDDDDNDDNNNNNNNGNYIHNPFLPLKDMLYALLTPICKRIPNTFTRNFEILEEVVKMFIHEDINIQVTMQEGLLLLVNEFINQSDMFKERLYPLLEYAITTSKSPSVIYVAVYYAIYIYPFSDIRCRYICLLALSHSKQEIKELAMKGLTPYHINDNTTTITTSSSNSSSSSSSSSRDLVIPSSPHPYPSFPAAVTYISSKLIPHLKSRSSMNDHAGGGGDENDHQLYIGSITFLEHCFTQFVTSSSSSSLRSAEEGGDVTMTTHDADQIGGEIDWKREGEGEGEGEEDRSIIMMKMISYLELIEFGFQLRGQGVYAHSAKALYNLVGHVPLITQRLTSRVNDLLKYLRSTRTSEPQEYLVKTLAMISEYLPLPVTLDLLDTSMSSIHTNSLNALKHDIVCGDLLLIGGIIGKLTYLSAPHPISNIDHSKLQSYLLLIISHLNHKVTAICQAAIQSIGCIARYAPLPLPIGHPTLYADNHPLPSSSSSPSSSTPPSSDITHLSPTIFSVLQTLRSLLIHQSTKEPLMEKIIHSITDIYLGSLLYLSSSSSSSSSSNNNNNNTDDNNIIIIDDQMMKIRSEDEQKERWEEIVKYSIESVFILSKIKHEEVLFTAGEALSCFGSGWSSKVIKNKILLNELPFILPSSSPSPSPSSLSSSSPNKVSRSCIYRSLSDENEPMERILSRLIRSNILNGSQDERIAGSIWLLSIVQYSGLSHVVLRTHLQSIQRAFTYMLASTSDLIQDIGAKGLILVYDDGDDSIKSELVSTLASTLSKGTKGFKVGSSSGGGSGSGSSSSGSGGGGKGGGEGEEAELFPAGMLGTTPDGTGGSLNTYKQLSSLASEMGKPELMYKFLNLSSHHQIWSSKRGAAFATQSILQSAHAKSQLQPYLKHLVPKLYRYSFDPNPRLSQSMSSVLNSMIDSSKVLDEYWNEIIQELLEGIGSRVWRVREACLSAIPDTLRSQSFSQLEPYFESLYTMIFRGMDDIKESVAKAGIQAAKSLSSITTRICDPTYTTSENVNKCLTISIPYLLEKGLANLADEVKMFSMNTLHSLCKSSGALISPFVPSILGNLLENLSLYEPAVFNYIDQKADEFGTTKEELEELRMKISSSSPLSKTIDLCSSHITKDTIKEIIEKINYLLSHGVGMPTRVGLSKLIVSLVKLHADILKPFIPRLLRRLTSTITNRSMAMRKANAIAIAHLTKLITSPTSTAAKAFIEMMKTLKDLYLIKSSSSSSDLSLYSSILSSVLVELSKTASSHVSDFNIDCLPICFIGTCDLSDNPSGSSSSSLSSGGSGSGGINGGGGDNRNAFIMAWNELGVGGAERIYLDEIISLVQICLQSSSWTIRQQGALVIIKLSERISGDALQPHLLPLLQSLEQLTSERRIWTGKEKIYHCFVSLLCSSSSFFLPPSPHYCKVEQIIQLMIEECNRGETEYKRIIYQSLNLVFNTFCPPLDLFDLLIPKLISSISSLNNQIDDDEKMKSDHQSPSSSSSSSSSSDDKHQLGKEKARKLLILAECFELIGSAWPITLTTQLDHYLSIATLLTSQLEISTWNIKIKILSGMRKIIKKIDTSVLGLEEFVTLLLNSLRIHVSDPKYAVVREAAFLTLKDLTIKLKGAELLTDYAQLIGEIINSNERENSVLLQKNEIQKYLNK